MPFDLEVTQGNTEPESKPKTPTLRPLPASTECQPAPDAFGWTYIPAAYNGAFGPVQRPDTVPVDTLVWREFGLRPNYILRASDNRVHYSWFSPGHVLSTSDVWAMGQLSLETNRARLRAVAKLVDLHNHAVARGEPVVNPGVVVDWRVREAALITVGDREPVQLPVSLPAIVDHFLCWSRRGDEPLWSYIENHEKGFLGRRLTTKPGRYLRKFYPDLTDAEVTRWAAVLSHKLEISLRFTTDPVEIERVYVQGPWSCMHYEADAFDTDDRHPARVYGSVPGSDRPEDQSDLALCYFMGLDPRRGYEEVPVGRALVWPKKKLYGRVYAGYKNAVGCPQNEAQDRSDLIEQFKSKLAEAGYSSPRGYDSLNGARIRKIFIRPDQLLMPYIDGSTHRFDVEDKHVVLRTDGDYEGDSTDGYIDLDGADTPCCERCSARIRPGDSSYYVHGHGDWCEDCYEDHASSCECCLDTYEGDELVTITTEVGTRRTAAGTTEIVVAAHQEWCPHCVQRLRRDGDIAHCHYLDEDVYRVDVVPVHSWVVSSQGQVRVPHETWSELAAQYHAVRAPTLPWLESTPEVYNAGDVTWWTFYGQPDAEFALYDAHYLPPLVEAYLEILGAAN